MTTERSWELRREGERPVNLNLERQGHHWQRAASTAQWRSDFAWLARAQRIPRLDRVRIIATPHYRTGRSMPDVGACVPSTKAAIDGLVDAGVIADDDPTHVVELRYCAPVVDGWDGLALVIEEVIEWTSTTGQP